MAGRGLLWHGFLFLANLAPQMTSTQALFPPWARRLLRTPPRLAPSEWAETYRTLPRGRTSRPGPWRCANAPYLTAIMDACATRGVQEIVVMKCAQAGVSEAIRNVIGWTIQCDPDPVLLVMPDEKSGRKIMRQRIMPMIRETPTLAELLPSSGHAVQVRTMTLANGWNFTLGWSGSASSLSSDPVRRAFLDEVDQYADWQATDGSPIELARARTQTYEHRRLSVAVSTPTTSAGYIAQLFDAADVRLYYHVPCPRCHNYQRLVWSRVKWHTPADTVPVAARIALRRTGAAWYECEHCGGRIEDVDRPAIVNRGVWASVEDAAAPDFSTRAAATQRNGVATPLAGYRSVAFHLNVLYCLWVHWNEVAIKFLSAKDTPGELYVFQTLWLGEPWTERIVRPTATVLDAKVVEAQRPPHVVPSWCSRLLATVDVQKDRFYFVVRAWGERLRSSRVAHGIAYSWEELESVALNAEFPIEGAAAIVRPQLLLIDAGYRSAEVCRWAAKDHGRVRVCKGASRPLSPPVKLYPPHDRQTDPHWAIMFWGGDFKDILAGYMQSQPTDEFGGESQWELDQRADPDYSRQMTAEHKIVVRRGSLVSEQWVPVSDGAANHYWDCEVMQCVGANLARPETTPTIARRMAHAQAPPAPAAPIARPETSRPFRRRY